MTVDIHDIETRLWATADELRANSKLKSSGYSIPVLGLIFLRHAVGCLAPARLPTLSDSPKIISSHGEAPRNRPTWALP
jgi:hypothetical protein